MKFAKNTPTILGLSHKLYETSLVFYPRDLRDNFGNEMVEVFDEQVSEAYKGSDFLGVLRVWFGATREIVTVAFPARLVEGAIPIIAVTATLAFMLGFAGYIGYVMETACRGCRN